MSGQAMAAHQDDEVVDLDAMTTAELLRERADVMAAIPMITAQLMDKERRPLTPEDDSTEWDEYRDWRRRARWALAHQKADLVTIKSILSERKDTGTIGNLLKMQTVPTEELTENARLYRERGALIREELAAQSTEGLLLRAYRVMRLLLQDYVNTLPEVLDEEARTGLIMVGLHCRQRYGTGRIKQYVEDPSSASGEVAP